MKPLAPTTQRKSRAISQPLSVLEIPDARLKKQTVSAVTGLSGSTIDRKVRAGTFPTPIKDGARCTRWVAGDVQSWLRVGKAVQ